MTKTVIDPKLRVSSSFKECWLSEDRYLIMMGGAGSGKSETAARKIITRCLSELNHRFLVMRKVSATLENSVIWLIRKTLDGAGISYVYKKNDRKLFIGGNTIIFSGLDNSEKIKSITQITGIWLEELSEFTEADFTQIDLRLRGKVANYFQIIGTLNPIMCWVKGYFFDKHRENSFINVSTIDDNPFIDKQYIKTLDNIPDKTYYQIYRLGQWGVAKGLVYNSTHFVYCAKEPKHYDDVFYGLDFGHKHPTSLVQVGVIEDTYYIKEIIYQSDLIISDVIDLIKLRIPKEYKNKIIYCDSQGSDKIETICRAGYNAIKSNKNVEPGISFVKGLDTHLLTPCSNIQKELGIYKWKEDKNGDSLDEPVKYMDDGLDSIRYALYTYNQHEKEISRGFGGV